MARLTGGWEWLFWMTHPATGSRCSRGPRSHTRTPACAEHRPCGHCGARQAVMIALFGAVMGALAADAARLRIELARYRWVLGELPGDTDCSP